MEKNEFCAQMWSKYDALEKGVALMRASYQQAASSGVDLVKLRQELSEVEKLKQDLSEYWGEYGPADLNEIKSKVERQERLTYSELRLLYLIDETVLHRQHEQQAQKLRKELGETYRLQLEQMLGLESSQIFFSQRDFFDPPDEFGENTVLFVGDLKLYSNDLTLKTILPKIILGNLTLDTKSIGTIELPEKISGDLNLSRLASVDGLVLPKKIGGDLLFNHLISAKNVVFPEDVGHSLIFDDLVTAENLTLPKQIGWSLDFQSLTSAIDLVFPEHVGGHVLLPQLTTAENLTLPKQIGWSLYLSGLTTAKGLQLPEKVGAGVSLPENLYSDGNLQAQLAAKGLAVEWI